MPRTVLSVISTLRRCGPVNVLAGIIKNYAPGKYRSVVTTLSPETGDSILPNLQSDGVPIAEMKLSRAESFLVGRRRLGQVMAQWNADLVHCHGFRANALAAACAPLIPVVSTVHCDLSTDYCSSYGETLGSIMVWREYAALRQFGCAVAVSRAAAVAAEAHGVHCEVIPNGIDLDLYCPPRDAREKALCRRGLGLPAERVVVLHTGALNSLKRPIELIAGFRSATLSQSAVLVIAGDGPLRCACERAVAGTRNIVFLGNRGDIPDLLRASDVLISNSSSEGLPLALLEACACGVRVIASDIPAHREIQLTFPQQVSLFAARGDKAVAAALDQHSPGAMAHAFNPPVDSLYAISSRRMSLSYQVLYQTLLARDRRPAEIPT